MEPLTLVWYVPTCSTRRAIDLLQMHFGSKQPNQQTKAKHEHKSFPKLSGIVGGGDYFLQETDELLRLIIIFVPVGSGTGPGQNSHVMVWYSWFPSELVCQLKDQVLPSHGQLLCVIWADAAYPNQTTTMCVWHGELLSVYCHEINCQVSTSSAEEIIDDLSIKASQSLTNMLIFV